VIRWKISLVITLGLLATGWLPAAHAQLGGLGDKLKKKAEKKVERKVEQKADEAMDGVINCLFGDEECVERARQEGKKVVFVGEDGKPLPVGEDGQPVSAGTEGTSAGGGKAVQGSASGTAGQGVWRNYDFTPGRSVWAATDFSTERIGRFPASQLEFVEGNMQIVELDGEHVLEVSASSVFRLKFKETLPPDFSLELDVRTGAPNMAINIFFTRMETAVSRFPSHYLSIWRGAGIFFHGNSVSSIDNVRTISKRFHAVKFQADGDYAILYVDHERAGNLPGVSIERSNEIEFHVTANANYRTYIKNIVLAAGLDQLYETLQSEGQFTTRGIYFDTASHVLRPESTPTLEQMQKTLAEHADLRITIEGHTDSRGDDGANLELSRRRADSVKAYLVDAGIPAERLQTEGIGAARPVADNTTEAGRQENRRVVLRKEP
jgi:outer membrane protein OmpA-like peptidoglycan-associated protein